MARRLSVVFVLALATNLSAAGWSRNFDDGTFQGLIEIDPNFIFSSGAIDEFVPSVVSGALRMDFAGLPVSISNPEDDSGVMIDPTPFGDTTAVMLMKWSTNPFYAATPGSEMNAGFVLRMDAQNFLGYVLVIDDNGGFGLTKLAGLDVQDICPTGSATIVDFDPSKDWWMRAECQADGMGGLILHGRVWLDGTAEPTDWQIECVDSLGVYPPNGVGIVANEDSGGNGQYVDVDNVSVGPIPEHVCYNHIDDDGDGLTDCDDPDCADAPVCQCHHPFADLDGDGDVDMDDFGAWQRCYTGPGSPSPFSSPACDCLDRNDTNGDGFFDPVTDGDNVIDSTDFAKFVGCFSGAGVPANPACAG